MVLAIDGVAVPVVWADTEAARALRARVSASPLRVETRRYGNFEQVGELGFSLPASDRRTTARPGDVMLYAGDKIVVFYGENAWAYTPLGRVDLEEGELAALLGGDGAILEISAAR